ncbi:hypothetical protein D3C77_299910 [compost metagenome]
MSTQRAIIRAITALPVEKTGTRVRSVKGVRPAVSADPAHRSTATSPSSVTLKRAASSFSPSGASVKLAAKASFTALKRGGQTPWRSGRLVICAV